MMVNHFVCNLCRGHIRSDTHNPELPEPGTLSLVDNCRRLEFPLLNCPGFDHICESCAKQLPKLLAVPVDERWRNVV